MRNKVLTGLLAFAVAFGLWVYVVTFISISSDRRYNNVPVTLQGEAVLRERSLMVTTQEFPNVTLNLLGSRTELDKLNSSNITLYADVSKIYEEGIYDVRLTPSYPSDVSENNLSVQDMKPLTVSIEIKKWASKTVPVDVIYTGTLPETYIADKENKILDTETITISGPEIVLDTIHVAQIEVNLNDRVENINEAFHYKLCKRDGEAVDAKLVTTDVESITLNLRIARMKEVPLLLTVIDGGGATKDTAQIKIEPETIGISGSDYLLDGIESIELGSIDLNEIPIDTEMTLPFKLPEGVINESGISEAKVTVRFPTLSTKTITVTKFKTINVPKGFSAKMITKALEVQMRGPKKKIDSLEASNLTVLVDLSEAQSGVVKIKAEITCNISDVSAVGIYSVSATVNESGK